MVEFKKFRVGSLFNVTNGRRVTKSSQTKGNIPYVTAVTTNNGIDTYIGNPPFIQDNLLTVNFFGNVYYHPYPVSYKDGTYGLKLIEKYKESKEIYTYLMAALEKTTINLGSYSKMLTGNLLKEVYIPLPVKSQSDEEPDWEYMENYIKDIEAKYIQQLTSEQEKEIELLREKVGNIGEINLSEVKFKEFIFEDIFKIFAPKGLLKKEIPLLSNGNSERYPFFQQKTTNGGVLGYYNLGLDLLNNKDCKPTLFGFTNTQNINVYCEPFYVTNTGNTYIIDADGINNYNIYYIKACLEKIFYAKYSYGRNNAMYRIKKEQLYLPVKSQSDEEPDWEYMENYIAKIELEKRVQLLNSLS